MPSRPAFGSSLNPWVGNHSMYWSQLPSHYKTFMSARPEHLSGRFSPHDWQEIQRRDIPVPGISSGPLGTGKVVTAEDASRHLEDAREAEELLRLQDSQQAVSSEPINLTELAGSSPLANLSLDPFAFTPDTGVEVPTVFANKGGAVMPGLGFRPLGYADGAGPRGVEDDYIGNVISQFNNLFTNNQMADVVNLVNANPEVFFARGLDPRVAGIVQNLVTQELVNPPPTANQITTQTEAFEASQAQDPESPIGAVGMPSPWNMGFIADSTVSPGEYTYADPGPWYETGGRLEDVGSTYPVEETVTDYQAGGHVGRGTMAGELGRRGDLSVRQAGETMFERMKRLRGYAGGGYASRGTMAGELPHHGDMSVREEGESMGELHKRHRDQDWYNRMGGGLGSFRRRMA